MSDDLISRKALLKELREIMDEPHNTMFLMGIRAAVSIIEHREMAFDKEKVIKELKTRRDWYDINEQPKNPRDTWEVCDIRERKGKWLAYNEAIEIIGKAGLNERNIVPGKKEKQR